MRKFKLEIKKNNNYLIAQIKERSVSVLENNNNEFQNKVESLIKLIIKDEHEKGAEFIEIEGDNRVRDKKIYGKLPYSQFKSYFIIQLRKLGYEVREIE